MNRSNRRFQADMRRFSRQHRAKKSRARTSKIAVSPGVR